MNNEYSIACLLDESSIKKLRNKIPFIETKNYLHVSLFQFRCKNDFLQIITKSLKTLSISYQFKTLGLSIVKKNIFLDIFDDGTLQKASDSLAEKYFTHCYPKEPLSQINLHKLNLNSLDLVKKYGIHWIKQNFRPHVTLSYNTELKFKKDIKIPNSISVLIPQIFQIDPIGRVLSIN